MHIVVAVKQVPDLVEELEVDTSGTRLDTTWLKYRLNEFDEHAAEQAVLLKEAGGHQITVVAPDWGDPDESLFTCLAKGCDQAVKVSGDWEGGPSTAQVAAALAPVIRDLAPDLVLTGVQAADDLDGQLGPLLAAHLGLPAVSVITGVSLSGAVAVAKKEFSGGVIAELEVDLPAVLGVQAAPQPPRYAPISRVRQLMKTAQIATAQGGALPEGPAVRRLTRPESAAQAEMIEGDAAAIAGRIAQILRDNGILRR